MSAVYSRNSSMGKAIAAETALLLFVSTSSVVTLAFSPTLLLQTTYLPAILPSCRRRQQQGAIRSLLILKSTMGDNDGDDHHERGGCHVASLASHEDCNNTTVSSPSKQLFSSIVDYDSFGGDDGFHHNSINGVTDSKLSQILSTEQAILLLNILAILWGTQHSIIKLVVDDDKVLASSFSLARFGLAALISSGYTPNLIHAWRHDETSHENEDDAREENAGVVWKWGIEMGMWMFLGYAFQAIGLEYTTAQRSGFLLYLNVKFVPFFARILLNRAISIPTWISAFTAVVGTALLSHDPNNGMSVFAFFNVGDAWSIGAAAASAMFILRLEAASAAVKNSSALNAASLWVVTLAALIWSVGDGVVATTTATADDSLTFIVTTATCFPSAFAASVQETIQNVLYTVTSHPWELVYLGGVTTALANYIQTKAQKAITAERASVIYAMDPVYGAVFANFLLKEHLSYPEGVIGAGLITLAAAANALLDLAPKNKDRDHNWTETNNATIAKTNGSSKVDINGREVLENS